MTCPGSVSRPGNPGPTPVLPAPWPAVRSDPAVRSGPEEARRKSRCSGERGMGGRSLCPSFPFRCKYPLPVVLCLPLGRPSPMEASALLTVVF